MLLRPNESICIQGAFFLSYAGGSKRAATWEPVQRLGGSGSLFPKQTEQGQAWISIEFTGFFFKERVEVESCTVTHSTLLSCTVLSFPSLCFSARVENSRGGFGTEGEDYSTACAPGEWQLLMSSPPSDLAP